MKSLLTMLSYRYRVVHRRWYQFPCVTTCDKTCFPHRTDYKEGKTRAREQIFTLTPAQKQHVEALVTRDVDFLMESGLMDYSLMVGVKYRQLTPQESLLPTNGQVDSKSHLSYGEVPYGNLTMPLRCVLESSEARPSHTDGNLQTVALGNGIVAEYWIGIIDFLQEWNYKKECAHWIKIFECDKSTVHPQDYGVRFRERLKERLSGDASVLPTDDKIEKSETPRVGLASVTSIVSMNIEDRSCMSCGL